MKLITDILASLKKNDLCNWQPYKTIYSRHNIPWILKDGVCLKVKCHHCDVLLVGVVLLARVVGGRENGWVNLWEIVILDQGAKCGSDMGHCWLYLIFRHVGPLIWVNTVCYIVWDLCPAICICFFGILLEDTGAPHGRVDVPHPAAKVAEVSQVEVLWVASPKWQCWCTARVYGLIAVR